MGRRPAPPCRRLGCQRLALKTNRAWASSFTLTGPRSSGTPLASVTEIGGHSLRWTKLPSIIEPDALRLAAGLSAWGLRVTSIAWDKLEFITTNALVTYSPS